MSDLTSLVELYKTSGLSSKEALEKAEDKEVKERAFYLEKEDKKLELEDKKLELERIKLEQIKQSGINAGEL